MRHEYERIYVGKKADEVEEKLVEDCRRGYTQKNGRPANLPILIRNGDYIYMRVSQVVQRRSKIEKSVAYQFCKALGFDVDKFYVYEARYDDNMNWVRGYYEIKL